MDFINVNLSEATLLRKNNVVAFSKSTMKLNPDYMYGENEEFVIQIKSGLSTRGAFVNPVIFEKTYSTVFGRNGYDCESLRKKAINEYLSN